MQKMLASVSFGVVLNLASRCRDIEKSLNAVKMRRAKRSSETFDFNDFNTFEDVSARLNTVQKTTGAYFDIIFNTLSQFTLSAFIFLKVLINIVEITYAFPL